MPTIFFQEENRCRQNYYRPCRKYVSSPVFICSELPMGRFGLCGISPEALTRSSRLFWSWLIALSINADIRCDVVAANELRR